MENKIKYKGSMKQILLWKEKRLQSVSQTKQKKVRNKLIKLEIKNCILKETAMKWRYH
jgi:hypothetical protein